MQYWGVLVTQAQSMDRSIDSVMSGINRFAPIRFGATMTSRSTTTSNNALSTNRRCSSACRATQHIEHLTWGRQVQHAIDSSARITLITCNSSLAARLATSFSCVSAEALPSSAVASWSCSCTILGTRLSDLLCVRVGLQTSNLWQK